MIRTLYGAVGLANDPSTKGETMSEGSNDAKCLACDRDSHATPLVPVEYQGARLWICPQHLPALIHNPGALEGKLPGAENMRPADHHD
jgi:hypothetical protein